MKIQHSEGITFLPKHLLNNCICIEVKKNNADGEYSNELSILHQEIKIGSLLISDQELFRLDNRLKHDGF